MIHSSHEGMNIPILGASAAAETFMEDTPPPGPWPSYPRKEQWRSPRGGFALSLSAPVVVRAWATPPPQRWMWGYSPGLDRTGGTAKQGATLESVWGLLPPSHLLHPACGHVASAEG